MFLKKNTASQTVTFALVNATTGAGLTGATVSVRRCLDGTFAAATGTVTEDANGYYKFAPSQADTNADQVGYFFTATSAIPLCLNLRTTAADMSDGVRFGLTALPNAAAGASGGVPTGDASGRVLLQPTQAGVTIPTVTTVTNRVTANADQFGGATVTATTSVTFPAACTVATTTGAVGSVTGAVGSVTGAVGSVTGNVGGNVVGSVGSVTAGVTVATNNDKAGYSLAVTPPTSAQIATAVWQDATAGDFTAVGSIGKSLYTSGNAPGAASGLALVGSNMGTVSSVSGAVGSVTGNVGGNVVGSVGSIAGGDFTATMKTSLNQSRPVLDWGNIANQTAAVALTGTTIGTVNSVAGTVGVDATSVRAAVGLASANLDTQLAAIPTAAQTADTTLRRAMANVEASATGDALSLHSLYGLVQQAQKGDAQTTPGTLAVKKTDGTTTLGTLTLTSDGTAQPIVKVA